MIDFLSFSNSFEILAEQFENVQQELNNRS